MGHPVYLICREITSPTNEMFLFPIFHCSCLSNITWRKKMPAYVQRLWISVTWADKPDRFLVSSAVISERDGFQLFLGLLLEIWWQACHVNTCRFFSAAPFCRRLTRFRMVPLAARSSRPRGNNAFTFFSFYSVRFDLIELWTGGGVGGNGDNAPIRARRFLFQSGAVNWKFISFFFSEKTYALIKPNGHIRHWIYRGSNWFAKCARFKRNDRADC